MGIDVDLIVDGVRLACAGDLVSGLVVAGFGLMILVALVAAMNRSRAA